MLLNMYLHKMQLLDLVDLFGNVWKKNWTLFKAFFYSASFRIRVASTLLIKLSLVIHLTTQKFKANGDYLALIVSNVPGS